MSQGEVIYAFRMPTKTARKLKSLAGKTHRSRSGVLRYLIEREAEQMLTGGAAPDPAPDKPMIRHLELEREVLQEGAP